MSYAACWAPDTIERAQAWIDTGHPTEGFWEIGAQIAAEVMDYAPAAAKTVVEYGCGVGRIIGQLDAPVRFGVDVSAEMLRFAVERFPEVHFLQGTGDRYPLGDDEADFACSFLVLQHMDAADAAAVVKDTKRILRPGGSCFLSFSAFGREWAEDAVMDRTTPMHATLAYTEEIVERLAADANLRIDEVQHDTRVAGYPNVNLVATA